MKRKGERTELEDQPTFRSRSHSLELSWIEKERMNEWTSFFRKFLVLETSLFDLFHFLCLVFPVCDSPPFSCIDFPSRDLHHTRIRGITCTRLNIIESLSLPLIFPWIQLKSVPVMYMFMKREKWKGRSPTRKTGNSSSEDTKLQHPSNIAFFTACFMSWRGWTWTAFDVSSLC